VRDYSNSEFAKKGKEYLEKLGKPIPEPANNNPAPERPGFMGKAALILGYNGLDITRDGVLLSKKGDEKEEVKQEALKKPSEASAAAGTRSIRANTKGVVDPATSSQPAPAVSTNGSNAAPAAASPAKPEVKKPDDEKKDKKKKKFGIFR